MAKNAKARISGTGRIIVDDCPYCHGAHYHNMPVGAGQRMADCYRGEYVLDFTTDETPEAQPQAPAQPDETRAALEMAFVALGVVGGNSEPDSDSHRYYAVEIRSAWLAARKALAAGSK